LPSGWEDPPDVRGVSFGMPSMTPVTKALLIANIALFVVQELLLKGTRGFDFLLDACALQPEQWTAHFPLVPVWQLLSYAFLHGSISHLLYNMLGLYFLGTLLEVELGSRRFAAFFLAAVAIAGLVQLLVGLGLDLAGPVLGASGGVLAIVCAMATLRPGLRINFIIVPMTLRTLALIYVALDLYGALMQFKGEVSGTANFAHLAGALFGYLAVRRSWIWRDPFAEVEAWRERRAEDRATSDAERLDALLERISREGIHSLSSSERAFLKRASQRK
jgi:membrane associated rhomboid family serine protease